MLMQLGEFGGDQAGLAGLLLGGQPQHPVPEVVIDAGQGGSGDLPCGQRGVRLGEDQVDLLRAGQDQHVAPGRAEPVPLCHHRAQPRDDSWQALPHLGERAGCDLEIPVR